MWPLPGGRAIQRAVEIEMQEFRYVAVPAAFPVGTYQLWHAATTHQFSVAVARTPRAGGYDVKISAQEDDNSNNPDVVTGDVVTATRLAYLNHISVEGFSHRVPGLGALLVYVFAAHVRPIADTITVTTMAPSAAGFYQAVGFPVAATAAAYFNAQRHGLDPLVAADVLTINAWNAREQTFNNAVANPGAAVGPLPYAGAPQNTPALIMAANAGRVGTWRRIV
jgi:hypothetical protein